MAADVAQRESRNIKHYVSAFSNIYIYIYISIKYKSLYLPIYELKKMKNKTNYKNIYK